MNLNLRKAIRDNLQGSDEEHIRHTIVDAIQSGEEKMLPGLGVLFELVWMESNEEDRTSMVSSIQHGLKAKT